MKHKEYDFQKACSMYLSVQYPNILFDSDTIASVKLTIPQASRNKAIQKNGFKRPDIAIYEPNGKYHGLFVELKTESPYKKNGELKSSEHLEGQNKTMEQLKQKGYYATFCWSFEQFKSIVDNYLNNRLC